MRNLRSPQLKLGEVRIEDIEFDIKSRDDIVAILSGLQLLYAQEAERDRLFALLDEHLLPGICKRWDVRAWRCGALLKWEWSIKV